MNWFLVPDWLENEREHGMRTLASIEERMEYVISLSSRNVQRATGGPFAAAVFERDSGHLVSMGVNQVLASACSHAHAEMNAIALAQRQYATHDLGKPGLPPLQLVSSCEPCTMCLGAICWSGIVSLVCGARDADVRALGFDEGPKPLNWKAEMTTRNIAVQTDLFRQEAVQVVRDYVESGGLIYSPARHQN